MTAPVELIASQGVVMMPFFMPSNFAKDDLPEPTDSRVKLVELKFQRRLPSYGFGDGAMPLSLLTVVASY